MISFRVLLQFGYFAGYAPRVRLSVSIFPGRGVYGTLGRVFRRQRD